MSAVQTDVPPEIARTDDVRVDFEFDTAVLDGGAVLLDALLADSSLGNGLVEEGVAGDTVVPVEGDVNAVEESEIETDVKSIGVFPSEGIIHKCTAAEFESGRATRAICRR